ncbi:MAG: NTP transferase domain-containing protein [Spirochaetales bacterium]|nr:NTP transferase domain-containing protein [Spirochaetales bacterium]
MKTVAMILAGGAGTRLDVLTEHRAKPAVPFGGQYRVIDFTLSNCANSGITNVAVLAQHFHRTISQHIGVGRPWDFDKDFNSVDILTPHHTSGGKWVSGTAQAVFQNFDFLTEQNAENVLVLCGDHVYGMDYRPMLQAHETRDADLTIAAIPVENENAKSYGILSIDENQKIRDFEEKPECPKSNLASMGVYVFRVSFLRQILQKVCLQRQEIDFGLDVIPGVIESYRAFAYPYDGYWRDVGTLEEYWHANMELLQPSPPLDLHDRNNLFAVHTTSHQLQPTIISNTGTVVRSIVSGGCQIRGTVENSVLSPNVVVEDGAIVRNSIIFDRTIVGRGSTLDRTILDKDVVVGASCRIGCGSNSPSNRERPLILHTGINVVGKSTHIPAGTTIERNCRVLSGVLESDFLSKTVKSGTTVFPSPGKI